MGKYFLVSKIINLPYSQYKGSGIRLTKELPASVDEVIVGLEHCIGTKKITTFRDSKGKIIERAFDYFDEPLKNRFYKYQTHNSKDESSMVTSFQVREYSLPRKFLKKYLKQIKGKKLALWSAVKVDTYYIKFGKHKKDNIHSMTRILGFGKNEFQTHTIIEFPHIQSNFMGVKRQKTHKKLLQFKVNPDNYKILRNSVVAQNVDMPKKDSFLGFRLLDIEDFKTPFVKYVLAQRGLSDMKIKVGSYIEKIKNGLIASAHFSAWNGVIAFNKLFKQKSKSKLAGSIYHEVEHAWQYYLNARNGCNHDSWGIWIYKHFGNLDLSPGLRAEADKYSEAINNYVTYDKDYPKHFNNLIEVLARKAGEAGKAKYDLEGYELRKAFPAIPEEFL